MSKIEVNTLNITDLMFGDMEEHDAALQNTINANPEYIETAKKIEKHYEKLKTLDHKMWFEMDSDVNTLEVIVRGTAFNEGFKLAVKLILSSVQ